MVKKYVEKLATLIQTALPDQNVTVECKHFFSGAALYVNGKICATLTPKGFAMKLPEKNREKLLSEGKAKKLKYFPKSPIKKEYVILSKSLTNDLKILRYYLKISINAIAEP